MEDKTKAKIQELVPEIMKIQKDCEVKKITYKLKIEGKKEILMEEKFTIFDINYSFDGERYHTNGVVYIENKITYPSLSDRMFGETGLKNHDNIQYEILGRPITLADVLLAIGKVRLENITLINLECNGNFVITEFPNNRTEKRIGAKWDLTKPYDDQSQETKDFIGQILGVK